MARKTLARGTSVATGYGYDIDKLYADLNEMLAEIYTNKRDAQDSVFMECHGRSRIPQPITP